MDNLPMFSLLVVLSSGLLSPAWCHAPVKSECEWKVRNRQDFLSDSSEITTNVVDVQLCKDNCINKASLTSCFTVRHNRFEKTCRYSNLEYVEVEEDKLQGNPNVDLYQLKCHKDIGHQILAINPVYAALAGMGGMVLLLFVTVIIIICVLSGNRK